MQLLNTPVLRNAMAPDISVIREIVVAAYQSYTTRLDKPPGPMYDDYEELIRQQYVWVLETSGMIAGILVLIPQDTYLLLDNVAVVPSCQGSGFGRWLVKRAESMATQLGYTEVRLYTNVLMTENIAFYGRLGFEETHRAEYGGYERVFMRKII